MSGGEQRLLRLDIGCGPSKLPGTLGVDVVPGPAVDHVVDLDKEPLPFADDSVGYVHSSHCLEHLIDPETMWKEITRVAANDASVELWLPYGWNNDAFVFGHKNFFNETHFRHLTDFSDHWRNSLGAYWQVRELVFVLEEGALGDLSAHGCDLPFALKYFKNVVREMGVMITIVKAEAGAYEATSFRKSYAPDRDPRHRRDLEAAAPLRQRLRRAVAGWMRSATG